ncbi:MAG: hypothetical protein M3O94_02595 [Actinomycetota bacterium]|jgi:hypothetical protein|nr:hypothetical protein [Actinomycetota bacterium]
MDRKMLDTAVPLAYAALLVSSALSFRAALAPIAVFGALGMAIWYTGIRRRLIQLERAAEDREGDGDGSRSRDE